jgi:hypothetical protein
LKILISSQVSPEPHFLTAILIHLQSATMFGCTAAHEKRNKKDIRQPLSVNRRMPEPVKHPSETKS